MCVSSHQQALNPVLQSAEEDEALGNVCVHARAVCFTVAFVAVMYMRTYALYIGVVCVVCVHVPTVNISSASLQIRPGGMELKQPCLSQAV